MRQFIAPLYCHYSMDIGDFDPGRFIRPVNKSCKRDEGPRESVTDPGRFNRPVNKSCERGASRQEDFFTGRMNRPR